MNRILGFLIFWSAMAMSHPFDMAYVQASFEGKTVKATLDLNPAIVAIILNIPSSEMSPATVSIQSQKLLSASLASGDFEYGGGKCSWSNPSIEFPNPNTVRVFGTASCPGSGDSFVWRFPFLRVPGIPDGFHLLVKAAVDGQERMQSGEAGNEVVSFNLDRQPTGWLERVKHKLGLR